MMATEQIRLILIVALCVVSFLLWDAWQRDYGPKPPPPPASTEPAASDTAPSGQAAPGADVPQAPQSARAERTAAPSSPEETDGPDRGRKIRVTTDVLAVDIDTVGGTIAGVDLRSYPISNDTPDEPFPPARRHRSSKLLHRAVRTDRRTVRAEPPHPLRVRRGHLRACRRHGVRRRPPAVALRRWCRGRAHVPVQARRTISSTYAPTLRTGARRPGNVATVRAAPARRAGERGRNLPDLHLHRRHPVGAREALREGRLLGHGEPGRRPRRRRRLGGDDPALLRRGLDPRIRRHQPLLLEKPAVRSIRHRRRGPGCHRLARKHRGIHPLPVCRSEDPGAHAGCRPAPGAHRRLWLAVAHRGAPVLAVELDPRIRRQLGLGDHHPHGPDQAGVLPALGHELQVDGADAQAPAAHHPVARALRRRQAAHETRR